MSPRAVAIACLLALAPLSALAQWEAPPSEKDRKNPVAPTNDALQKGRALYQKHCASCHGRKGKGDGPAAGYRSGTPVDLTNPELREMPDGEIFWKISTGLKEDKDVLMPAFTKEMPNELDRWKVILFVRTLHATGP